MFDSGIFSQIVDFAFVGLVLFLTWRSFSSQPQIAAEKSEKWHAELRSLADILRELIGEASAASSALDRNLLKRKEDLERILLQAEAAKRSLQETLDIPTLPPKPEPARKPARKKKPAPAGDLPNKSWTSEGRAKPPPAPALQRAPAAKPGRPPTRQEAAYAAADLDDDDDLAELAALQDDRLELSSTAPVPPDYGQAGGSSLQSLASRVASDDEQEDEALEVSSLSSLNPTAVRVAERLLTSGQEIHVVARKLELPVAVVRALDRVIRRQAKTGANGDGREVVAKGIFPRQKQAEAPAARHAPLFRNQTMTRKQVTL